MKLNPHISPSPQPRQTVGVDGCRSGWVAASSADHWQLNIFGSITNVIHYYGPESHYLVDTPMGLPDQSFYRTCEDLARQLLAKEKKSSIFNVPCRAAVYCDSYQQANTINKQVLGKGLSVQSWNIAAKIRGIDTLLIDNKALRLRESHPELCFQVLNNNIPLLFSKKTREGQLERIGILSKYTPQILQSYQTALQKYPRTQVLPDDLLDALCLAVSATFPLTTLPTPPHMDAMGITTAIHYPTFTNTP